MYPAARKLRMAVGSDRIMDPDGATTIISPPMTSTLFIEKWPAFYNSSGLLKLLMSFGPP